MECRFYKLQELCHARCWIVFKKRCTASHKLTGSALENLGEKIMKMSKTVVRLILILTAIGIAFTGCSADMAGRRMGEQIKSLIEPSSEQLPDQIIAPSENISTEVDSDASDSETFPIVFRHSHAGDGAILVSVNNVKILNQRDDLLNPDAFLEEFAYAYGGSIYDSTLYEYPDFFSEDGNMQEGISMILLDVTVSNPDGATSRYRNAYGEWVNHYDDPYMFQAQSLCELMRKESATGNGIRVSYFTAKNDKLSNPACFVLNPDEEVTFQLGFLVGYEVSVKDNVLYGIPTQPDDLMLWALLPDGSPHTWELYFG